MNKLFVFFSHFFLITTVHANTSTDIQTSLDQFREKSLAPAAVLSIYFPANNKSLDFTSGTVIKKSAQNPNPKKVTVDNLFQIGSITKSFTAAIILQLEAEGKLSINDTLADTVKKYGPWLDEKELAAWKHVTIKQLLNMTSGIFDISDDKKFNEEYLVKHPDKQWTPQEELKIVLAHPNLFQPGQRYQYSNTNYFLLGMLIEAITKHDITTEMNQRLIQPLKLVNTYYMAQAYPEKIARRMAHGYAYPGGEFVPPAKAGSDMTFVNMSVAGASGAMVSTPRGIIQWVDAIFSQKLFPKQQLDEMMSAVCMEELGSCQLGKPLATDAHAAGFGLGIVRMYDAELGVLWIYVGGAAGYYSAYAYAPDKKIIVALTVSSSSTESKRLLHLVVDVAKKIYKGVDA